MSFVQLSRATDLLDVYHHALENDPIFKAAYNTFLSQTEAISIAQSALRPQLSITGLGSRNYTLAITNGFSTSQSYDSEEFQLKATQAIFNLQAWAEVRQAKAHVRAAHAQFNDQAQDLILRVAKAYFNVLLSRDTLNFVQSKKRANARQLMQAQQRFDVGLDSITAVYEAKAAYDQSIAEVIAAQNDQLNQNENIRKLTNQIYDYLSPLRNSTIPLIKPEPNNVEDWITAGIKQNYKLFAAKFNLQAARENIKVQASGNLPVIAIQGNADQARNNSPQSDFFVPAVLNTADIGVSLTFPAYQGGLTNAQTRKAQYDFQTVSENLERIYRGVLVDSRIAFNTIVDGISKVKADRQSLISQQNALESTEAQFQVGTQTMVNILNAERRLCEVQKQLATDQYNFIFSLLKLKYLAGSLNASDIEEINAWLKTTRINGLLPKDLSHKHIKHKKG